MNILNRLRGAWYGWKIGASLPPTYRDEWNQLYPMLNASGVPITHDSAMRIAATWACIRILAETVGSLPIKIFKRDGDDKEPAPDHPLYKIVHNKPNGYQTPISFKEMVQAHMALRGNGYCEIVWDRGVVTELRPIRPERVMTERISDQELRYKVREPQGKERIITSSRMLHIPALSFDGLVGLSPIESCAQSFGVSLASETFAASFYGNGATMGNVLSHPSTLSKQAREHLEQSFKDNHSGPDKANKTLILEEDMKWTHMGVKPEEAQFIETRKFSVQEIARIFRVPPHMIGDLERATFSNIEQQSLEFVKYTMMPWLIRWEEAINKKLLLDDPVYFAEFVVDALLRADIKSRYEAYEIGVNGQRGAFMTVNEVRRKENMNPIPGKDEIREPMNAPMGGDFEGDRVEDPMAFLIKDAAGRIDAAWTDTKDKEKHKRYISKTIHPIATAFRKPLDITEIGEYVEAGCEGDTIQMIERVLHVR